MTYYNINKDNVELFLNEVHAQMVLKYTAQNDSTKAKKLQSFLQSLKNRSIQKQGYLPITNDYANMVIEALYQKSPRTRTKGLFLSKGGSSFEYDLSNVIDTVYSLVIHQHQSNSAQYRKGAEKGTIIEGILDDTVKEITSELHSGVKKTLSQDAKMAMGIDQNKSLLVAVEGKVDVQGGFLHLNIVPTNSLEEMALILDEAVISAKNYSSLSSKLEDLDSKYSILKIGTSNPYRAYAGALSSLQYDSETIRSSFISAYFARQRQDISRHIWHLRAIYEYAGTGITNIADGSKAREVNYLIYNDPTGSNIYVESVAEILVQYLNSSEIPLDNPFGAITIKKSFFKNASTLF